MNRSLWYVHGPNSAQKEVEIHYGRLYPQPLPEGY